MKKFLIIILIIALSLSAAYAFGPKMGMSTRIDGGSGLISYEVYNVTDNGGEAYRVTDNGGEDYNVR